MVCTGFVDIILQNIQPNTDHNQIKWSCTRQPSDAPSNLQHAMILLIILLKSKREAEASEISLMKCQIASMQVVGLQIPPLSQFIMWSEIDKLCYKIIFHHFMVKQHNYNVQQSLHRYNCFLWYSVTKDGMNGPTVLWLHFRTLGCLL